MALELLRGRPLDRVLAERERVDWREALPVARRVAEALHHAHAHGVVHRDIKPANIMLLESGEPKIMDFGIAKLEASQLTASGQFLGTPLYMSPEQAMAHPVDGRSDLFSLGAVLYEMLTGRQAFAGESVTKILFQIMSRDPEPPSVLDPGLPPAIDDVLARCLAKDAAVRYPDGGTLAADLADLLAEKPPRGMQAWRRPTASGTLVAPASPVVAPPAAAIPARHAASAEAAHPMRPLVWATTAGLVAAIAIVVGAYQPWKQRAEPVARRVAATGPAEAEREPVRAADESNAAARPTDPARLLINFEHSLRNGMLRVWVDDQPVIEEEFGGRVTKEIAGFRLRKGSLSDTLEVAPGRREVRVEVSWDDNTKTERTFTTFKPGATHRLKAKLGSLGGIKKDLSLDWY
jgi:eukaryotic-like serine/threonine-protein kinase